MISFFISGPVPLIQSINFLPQADLTRILAEQEETQEPTEERIGREKAALLEAGAKLMEMEAELVDTRIAEMNDVIKRKDQLEDDLRKEWEELEVINLQSVSDLAICVNVKKK